MYFTLTQIQYLMLALFGGLLLVAVIIIGYLSFRLNLAGKRPDEETALDRREPVGDDALELSEGRGPIPLFLTLLIAAFLIWGISYVIAVAMGGLNVQ